MYTESSQAPATVGTSIVVNTADRSRCRSVYIGASADYDFSLDGTTWVLFKGCVAGMIVPIQAVGARHNSGSSAPDAGDIVFLY
jgi:hypothetical protein